LSLPDATSSAIPRTASAISVPVVDAHRERENVVVARELLGELQLLDHRRPQPRAATGPPHPHSPLVELVSAPVQHIAVEAHEEADLVGRPRPVLGRERIDAQVLDTDLDGSRDDVQQ
jgi:hypothetical protein